MPAVSLTTAERAHSNGWLKTDNAGITDYRTKNELNNV